MIEGTARPGRKNPSEELEDRLYYCQTRAHWDALAGGIMGSASALGVLATTESVQRLVEKEYIPAALIGTAVVGYALGAGLVYAGIALYHTFINPLPRNTP